jgi:cytoskeletal protein CcmA (bactofilin family)
MFQKKNDKLESFIGINSEFRGDITVSGTLRIDGKLTGNITAGWIVVEVTLKADDIVELKPSAHLYGDICSKKLVIAEGGEFMGRSVTQGNDAKLLDFSGEAPAQ